MRDTSERVAGTAKGNHQLRRRRTEEGGTRHGEEDVTRLTRRLIGMCAARAPLLESTAPCPVTFR